MEGRIDQQCGQGEYPQVGEFTRKERPRSLSLKRLYLHSPQISIPLALNPAPRFQGVLIWSLNLRSVITRLEWPSGKASHSYVVPYAKILSSILSFSF